MKEEPLRPTELGDDYEAVIPAIKSLQVLHSLRSRIEKAKTEHLATDAEKSNRGHMLRLLRERLDQVSIGEL